MTDIVSSMGLSIFPIVGLALFLSVFVGLVFWLVRAGRDGMASQGMIPLEDGQEVAPDRGAER